MVESAALEMRCTHYVVPGVRIPHSPQRNKQANRSFFFEQGASGSLLGFRGGIAIGNVGALESLTLRFARDAAGNVGALESLIVARSLL